MVMFFNKYPLTKYTFGVLLLVRHGYIYIGDNNNQIKLSLNKHNYKPRSGYSF